MSRLDVNQLLIDLASATDTIQKIRNTAVAALPNTGQTRAAHDPLLDIVNAADMFLRHVPKEEPR